MAESSDWRPTARFEILKLRARLLTRVRRFFSERGVLEVETPVLATATVSDLHLASYACRPAIEDGLDPQSRSSRPLYLQTSPEYAMKRLLAAGSGPIYQLGRAFRAEESGRWHNPEFTLLEWYRTGFDHLDLMAEVDEFLQATLGSGPATRLTYAEAFERWAGLDPHRATTDEIFRAARRLCGDVPGLDGDDRDGWLDVLLTSVVEPHLGSSRTFDGRLQPAFLYDYPASQAALAKIRRGGGREPDVAERFEVYVRGIELANGFHELIDAEEQRRRFADDNAKRQAAGRPPVDLDERFLAALETGLPPSAGVALGFDRLVVLAAEVEHIDDVLTFPIDRA